MRKRLVHASSKQGSEGYIFMQVKIIKSHKSIPAGIEFDLPDLTILTGINGSGKSHLLEAISGKMAQVTQDGSVLERITYVPFGGLTPQIADQGSQQEVMGQLKSCWQTINSIQNQAKNYISVNGMDEARAINAALNNNPAHRRVVEGLVKRTKKENLLSVLEDDVIKYVNVSELVDNGMFFGQFAQIFKSYMIRFQKNEFNEYLCKQKGRECKYLTTDEFEAEYGPKPWVLVNGILKEAGLPYRVTDPESIDMDADFRLRLVDESRNLEISVNDMSTGEKVLMSLALAIYNSNENGVRSDILLIDEPDAALHPHYSKILINTIKRSIVDVAKTKVILTTHSPATVAMCPDGSVYQIGKDSKIPLMISVPEALNILTEGIPHLKVSVENRLQVFVESKYDVAYYERMYNLLKRQYDYLKTPVFLEPHSGTSNCGDVIGIASRLNNSGNDLVRGIIDWDGNNTSSPIVKVLGAGSRYAIENYLLDPVYVCLALVRERRKKFAEFGVASKESYVSAGGLSEAEVQSMAEYVFQKLGLANGDRVACELENGFSLSYPSCFLLKKGHEYEADLLRLIPELNSVKKGNGDSALKLGVLGVIEEFPQYISKDWNSTFVEVLGLAV